MLDVADNLQRAADAVPASALDGSEELDAERVQKLLRSLVEGVNMTDRVLMQVCRVGAARCLPYGRLQALELGIKAG